MAKRSHPLLWGAAFTGAALLLPGLNTTLRIRRYTVRTGRFSSPVRLAVASDVHAGDYGEGQNRLLSAIRSQAPDLILIPGDLFDRRRDKGVTVALRTPYGEEAGPRPRSPRIIDQSRDPDPGIAHKLFHSYGFQKFG